MKTVDQDKWLADIAKARGIGFYVFRFAELWANAVEYYLAEQEKKGRGLTPSKIAETVAEAHFYAEAKVLKEMRERHPSLPTLPPPDAVRVLETLKTHWANAELLSGWKVPA
jgi:hypothetical protein